MNNKRSSPRTFNGMSYREVQRVNSTNRSQLSKDEQQWLKRNGCRNTGWDNIISLYQKIAELLEKSRFADMSLEELFLEADRIGNKYLSASEIAEFNQQFAQEVAEIGELVDQQFPDTEIEIVDYSQRKPLSQRTQRKRSQKTYRTQSL
ncbi:MAG: hypothetical protein IGS50_09130 [Synechococcales cyanobacterium C42_A2020_086]|jgi:hypothetical protein|nr:hypothetical protein [Synechococcales cyanobacterium C42_A2020_086]